MGFRDRQRDYPGGGDYSQVRETYRAGRSRLDEPPFDERRKRDKHFSPAQLFGAIGGLSAITAVLPRAVEGLGNFIPGTTPYFPDIAEWQFDFLTVGAVSIAAAAITGSVKEGVVESNKMKAGGLAGIGLAALLDLHWRPFVTVPDQLNTTEVGLMEGIATVAFLGAVISFLRN